MLEGVIKSYTLPEHRRDITEIEEQHNIIRIPWIPKLGPKLRKAYRRYGIKTIFSSTQSLNNILCNQKSKLPHNSNPGVYRLQCKCNNTYIGETKIRISTRVTEHQKDVFHMRWKSSGVAEHAKKCDAGLRWEEAETL